MEGPGGQTAKTPTSEKKGPLHPQQECQVWQNTNKSLISKLQKPQTFICASACTKERAHVSRAKDSLVGNEKTCRDKLGLYPVLDPLSPQPMTEKLPIPLMGLYQIKANVMR